MDIRENWLLAGTLLLWVLVLVISWTQMTTDERAPASASAEKEAVEPAALVVGTEKSIQTGEPK